jgi:hypothetical protein
MNTKSRNTRGIMRKCNNKRNRRGKEIWSDIGLPSCHLGKICNVEAAGIVTATDALIKG